MNYTKEQKEILEEIEKEKENRLNEEWHAHLKDLNVEVIE